MLFSDNVSLDEEVALKRAADARGSLVMGPDCGTAIIDGIPLAFANGVRRGAIGWSGRPALACSRSPCSSTARAKA